MVRTVGDDEVKLLKPKGNDDYKTFEPALTNSLAEAVRFFWMATAARAARGQEKTHSSMLIHTTLYADVHDRFRPHITTLGTQIREGLAASDSAMLKTLRDQWETECARVPASLVGETATTFDALRPKLSSTIERTVIVVENSRSDIRLEYEGEESIQIVIGGNTLSRGLTLEGLVVSFFVRASTAFDTLLQMGRWFGYRRGYADLARIWMTKELQTFFFELATVEREIRNDIRRYELESLTPLQFGPRIRTHPQLSITSALKMGKAIDCSLSYSDRRVQTILFRHKEKEWLTRNLDAGRHLIDRIREDGIGPNQVGNRWRFMRVPVKHVVNFLKDYEFHENSRELKRDLLIGYISDQLKEKDLERWNVVIIGRRKAAGATLELGPAVSVTPIERSRLKIPETEYANLGVIMSEIDRVADLDLSPSEIKESDPQSMRNQKLPGTGLLLLYPISKDSKPKSQERVALDAVEDVLGVGLVFPKAAKDVPLRYKTVDLSKVPREELEPLPEEDEDVP